MRPKEGHEDNWQIKWWKQLHRRRCFLNPKSSGQSAVNGKCARRVGETLQTTLSLLGLPIGRRQGVVFRIAYTGELR
jgi:hypothetical protein